MTQKFDPLFGGGGGGLGTHFAHGLRQSELPCPNQDRRIGRGVPIGPTEE